MRASHRDAIVLGGRRRRTCFERGDRGPVAEPGVDPGEPRVDDRRVAAERPRFLEQHGADLQPAARGEEHAERAARRGFVRGRELAA